MRLRWWLTVCALGVTTAGCYPKLGGDSAAVEPPLVETMTVREEPAGDALVLVGRTEPWREATLYFEVSGVVAEMLVEEGAEVKQGDPIARLVTKDYEIALAAAEAQRDTAAARLALLRAGTRVEDMELAKADYARAQARASFWSGEYERRNRLFSQGRTVTQAERDEARQELDAAQESRRMAKARLDRATAGARKEEIDAATAEVKAQDQTVAAAQRQLDKATLRAPFAGRVEKRLLDPGAYVAVFPLPTTPVAQLVDLAQVDAVIAVPEAHHKRFAPQQKVTVTSAIDKTLHSEATVVSVGRTADTASGTYEVRGRMPNTDMRFTGGMVIYGSVGPASTPPSTSPSTPSRAIRIPITAVRRAYGQLPYVLVAESKGERQTAAAREVRLGATSGEQIEVLGGLRAGESLIVRGQHLVVPGDAVRTRATNSGR
jgi:HlyD family secretion protein